MHDEVAPVWRLAMIAVTSLKQLGQDRRIWDLVSGREIKKTDAQGRSDRGCLSPGWCTPWHCHL